MTRVNLLPPEVKSRRRSRRLTRLVAVVAAVVVLLVIGLYFVEMGRLSTARSNLQAQQATNRGLQTQVNGLQRYAQLASELTARQSMIQGLTTNQVLWSGALRNLSMVIPSDVYLTSVSGSLQAVPTSTGATGGNGLIGSIQFQGVATNYPAVALWLNRVQEVTGWTNAWVSSVTKSTSTGTVTFSGSIDLTPKSAVNDGKGVSS